MKHHSIQKIHLLKMAIGGQPVAAGQLLFYGFNKVSSLVLIREYYSKKQAKPSSNESIKHHDPFNCQLLLLAVQLFINYLPAGLYAFQLFFKNYV